MLPSVSPTADYGVVFEDDGVTGYFYGVEYHDTTFEIIASQHIYNVASVIDREIPSTVEIVWSEDGLKATLLINDHQHAVIDFATPSRTSK